MRVQTMYCSAKDGSVPVLLLTEPTVDQHAAMADVEFFCLELGDHCTGALCPLCAQTPEDLESKLGAEALEQSSLPRGTAFCLRCKAEREVVLLNREYAWCPGCRTTAHRRAPQEAQPT